jgi:hypothetical protein
VLGRNCVPRLPVLTTFTSGLVRGNVDLGISNCNGRLHYDLGLYYYYYPRADPALHANYAELRAKLTSGNRPMIPVFEAYVSSR